MHFRVFGHIKGEENGSSSNFKKKIYETIIIYSSV
jgi:hypothetical protein